MLLVALRMCREDGLELHVLPGRQCGWGANMIAVYAVYAMYAVYAVYAVYSRSLIPLVSVKMYVY